MSATEFLVDSMPEDAKPGYLKECRETASGVLSRWVKVYDVVGKCHLRSMSPTEFKAAVKSKLLPSRNSYFVRPLED